MGNTLLKYFVTTNSPTSLKKTSKSFKHFSQALDVFLQKSIIAFERIINPNIDLSRIINEYTN